MVSHQLGVSPQNLGAGRHQGPQPAPREPWILGSENRQPGTLSGRRSESASVSWAWRPGASKGAPCPSNSRASGRGSLPAQHGWASSHPTNVLRAAGHDGCSPRTRHCVFSFNPHASPRAAHQDYLPARFELHPQVSYVVHTTGTWLWRGSRAEQNTAWPRELTASRDLGSGVRWDLASGRDRPGPSHPQQSRRIRLGKEGGGSYS